MVVEAGDTLGLPVPTNVPPQLPVYQVHDAPVPRLPPVAERVVAPPQVGFTEAVAPVGAVELVLTDTEAVLTGAAEPQELLAVSV